MVAAKAPQAGAVKTRLCPPLSAAQAADLAAALLQDSLRLAAAPGPDADCLLALHDGGAGGITTTPSPSFIPVTAEKMRPHAILRQRGDDLGERLVHLFADVFAFGYNEVCVIGADAPHLPAAFLLEAFGRLGRKAPGGGGAPDVVLGPADDGGYYLVALPRPAPEMFEDIPWGGPDVLAMTRARAGASGRTVALLPPWYDIDTIGDLNRLRGDLRRGLAEAPSTGSFLQSLNDDAIHHAY